MTREDAGADMPLTTILREWLELKEWADPVEIDRDRMHSQVSTHYGINGQDYRLYFDIDEKDRLVTVTIYSFFNVPVSRMNEIASVLNRINTRIVVGKFSCLDDEKPHPVRFTVAFDFEGGDLSTGLIQNMINAAGGAMDRYGALLVSTALTKLSVEAVWEDFVDGVEEQSRGSESVARSLH